MAERMRLVPVARRSQPPSEAITRSRNERGISSNRANSSPASRTIGSKVSSVVSWTRWPAARSPLPNAT